MAELPDPDPPCKWGIPFPAAVPAGHAGHAMAAAETAGNPGQRTRTGPGTGGAGRRPLHQLSRCHTAQPEAALLLPLLPVLAAVPQSLIQ